MPAGEVERLLGAVFREGGKLGKQRVHAYHVSRERAIEAVSIPLHPVAARFLGAR